MRSYIPRLADFESPPQLVGSPRFRLWPPRVGRVCGPRPKTLRRPRQLDRLDRKPTDRLGLDGGATRGLCCGHLGRLSGAYHTAEAPCWHGQSHWRDHGRRGRRGQLRAAGGGEGGGGDSSGDAPLSQRATALGANAHALTSSGSSALSGTNLSTNSRTPSGSPGQRCMWCIRICRSMGGAGTMGFL